MNDLNAIERLIDHHGSVAKAAGAIGISETRMANWRRRGISNEGRPLVYAELRRLGVKLPVEWAFAREHDYSNLGANNGRAGNRRKASPKPKGKRRRPQQSKQRRRPGRGVSTVAQKNRGRAGRRGAGGQAAQI